MSKYLDNVNAICELLQDGKVVLCPTDTIWGLSCDATHESAVQKIYDIKLRDRNKPLILLIESIKHLHKYVVNLHPRVEELMLHYTKPLTIIHQASPAVPSFLLGPDNTIAIRVINNNLLCEIIKQLKSPLVSTSANKQGEPSPTFYDEVGDHIKSQVDYIFYTARENKKANSASTIIKYSSEGELIFIR